MFKVPGSLRTPGCTKQQSIQQITSVGRNAEFQGIACLNKWTSLIDIMLVRAITINVKSPVYGMWAELAVSTWQVCLCEPCDAIKNSYLFECHVFHTSARMCRIYRKLVLMMLTIVVHNSSDWVTTLGHCATWNTIKSSSSIELINILLSASFTPNHFASGDLLLHRSAKPLFSARCFQWWIAPYGSPRFWAAVLENADEPV